MVTEDCVAKREREREKGGWKGEKADCYQKGARALR